jgi:hypothetical protein
MPASLPLHDNRIGGDQPAAWMTKMDSLGMGLGAGRDELAPLQLIELYPLPQTMERPG